MILCRPVAPIHALNSPSLELDASPRKQVSPHFPSLLVAIPAVACGNNAGGGAIWTPTPTLDPACFTSPLSEAIRFADFAISPQYSVVLAGAARVLLIESQLVARERSASSNAVIRCEYLSPSHRAAREFFETSRAASLSPNTRLAATPFSNALMRPSATLIPADDCPFPNSPTSTLPHQRHPPPF